MPPKKTKNRNAMGSAVETEKERVFNEKAKKLEEIGKETPSFRQEETQQGPSNVENLGHGETATTLKECLNECKSHRNDVSD